MCSVCLICTIRVTCPGIPQNYFLTLTQLEIKPCLEARGYEEILSSLGYGTAEGTAIDGNGAMEEL